MKNEDVLQNKKFTCRVSSTLNRNATMFGKKFMFDSDKTTCWNSDEGRPQWIELEFEESVSFSSFCIQFQGGFVGSDCLIQTSNTESADVERFYTEDNNSMQTFHLYKQKNCTNVKFIFQDSSDTYGRIVIYKLCIFD